MTVRPKYMEPSKPGVKRCEETDEYTPRNSTDRVKPFTLLNNNIYTLSLAVYEIIFSGLYIFRFVSFIRCMHKQSIHLLTYVFVNIHAFDLNH